MTDETQIHRGKTGKKRCASLKRNPQNIIIDKIFFEIESLEFIEEFTCSSDNTSKGDQQLVLIFDEALHAFLNSIYRYTLHSFLGQTKDPFPLYSTSHIAPKKQFNMLAFITFEFIRLVH